MTKFDLWNQYCKRVTLDPFILRSVLISGVALTQAQDLALGCVEPHEVHSGPLLKPLQVPLDGILSLRCVNHTTQLGVVSKRAEGALDPTVYVIDEDTEQYQSQYRPLGDTNHYPLDVTNQPIPHPLNSPPIKPTSLQFREKNFVGDHVKGLTEVQIDDSVMDVYFKAMNSSSA
ncbi:hypothetical protein llap_8474 [Limosa lapponica baueri]|uniref:Uncharacterized protein n=1 Tax=Limosa lapponica baueri TaxID=1758121 RepID=A0A2I0U5C8_LIMLA|nr:hypothetical protein llap_8474 [Limosa lapponica baueri]